MNLIGNLLIAPPVVKGNFWYKTVIMVLEHHNQGSLGIVLNKRGQTSVQEFTEQLGYDIDLPGYVYIGGPVNSKSFSFLHTNDWKCLNTRRINSSFSISSSTDIFTRLADGDAPEQWRMFMGTCGWAPNQLNCEIQGLSPFTHDMSWCLASSTTDLVFDSDNKDQWVSALDRSGLEFAQTIF
jgi:putative transcriptional regulator